MKRKIYSAFAIAAAMMLVPSCSSDEEKIASIDNEEAVELQFGIDMNDITRAADIADCFDPDAITNLTHGLYIEYTLDGTPGSFSDNEFIRETDTKKILSSKKHFKPVTSTADKKHTFVITKAELTPLASFTPEYSAIAKTSDPNDEWKGIVDDKYRLGHENIVRTSDKSYLDIVMVCKKTYPDTEFGQYWVSADLYKKICIPVIADICGEPCDRNSESMRDHFAYAKIIIERFEKDPTGDRYWPKPSWRNTVVIEPGNKGTLCFVDKGSITDTDEGFYVNITMGTESYKNMLKFEGWLTVEDLYYIEANLNTEVEGVSYLDLKVCPDKTWEDWEKNVRKIVLAPAKGTHKEVSLPLSGGKNGKIDCGCRPCTPCRTEFVITSQGVSIPEDNTELYSECE